ncbi:high mobility group nucleosome-binding domain-containing protein 5-like [Neltuma alba]|uniref:high mobility group nucleosome-binding domain-containing protein 5-like n=1 Tax=Neltuma alba TaxID=207710 RepID=UPI0010A56572|nr:high mobility group nucleosome-binding domain-containing protein 5-like [Prosopis alba]
MGFERLVKVGLKRLHCDLIVTILRLYDLPMHQITIKGKSEKIGAQDVEQSLGIRQGIEELKTKTTEKIKELASKKRKSVRGIMYGEKGGEAVIGKEERIIVEFLDLGDSGKDKSRRKAQVETIPTIISGSKDDKEDRRNNDDTTEEKEKDEVGSEDGDSHKKDDTEDHSENKEMEEEGQGDNDDMSEGGMEHKGDGEGDDT